MLRAVSRAAAYGEFAQSQRPAPHRPDGTGLSAARNALGAGSTALTEQASKRVFAAYGLPVTQESLATAAEAVAFARRLRGPVALKIQSPDIPQKTECGGASSVMTRKVLTGPVAEALRSLADKLSGLLALEPTLNRE